VCRTFSSEIPVSLGHGFLATTLNFLDRLAIFRGAILVAVFSASFITGSAARHALRSAAILFLRSAQLTAPLESVPLDHKCSVEPRVT
jgi:hypothetical protein